MTIRIDNGQGSDTHGKRSPDGLFREYSYTREIARRVVSELSDCGYDARLLVPDIEDIPLQERCHRVYAICDEVGTANVILVSIHINASSSDRKWHTASGWSAYTTPGITRSDLLAADLYEAARKHLAEQRIHHYNGPKEPDFENNFYVLRHSKCLAVLTENLYQDCRFDVVFLQSSAGKRAIVMLHVEGIVDYLSL